MRNPITVVAFFISNKWASLPEEWQRELISSWHTFYSVFLSTSGIEIVGKVVVDGKLTIPTLSALLSIVSVAVRSAGKLAARTVWPPLWAFLRSKVLRLPPQSS